MYNLIALGAVAGADIARSVWVMDAVLDSSRSVAIDPRLSVGLILITGGLSLALMALITRAILDHRHGVVRPEPSS